MRVSFWLILGLIISIIIMDLTMVWTVRWKIVTAIEHSLDAALVDGILEDSIAKGKIYIDEEIGRKTALNQLKNNLYLDDNLDSKFLKNTAVEYLFNQDGKRIIIRCNFRTVISVVTPKILGLKGIPITIQKSQYHISKFK